MEILEVNLFAFAYRLFHEEFSPVFEVYLRGYVLHNFWQYNPCVL